MSITFILCFQNSTQRSKFQNLVFVLTFLGVYLVYIYYIVKICLSPFLTFYLWNIITLNMTAAAAKVAWPHSGTSLVGVNHLNPKVSLSVKNFP